MDTRNRRPSVIALDSATRHRVLAAIAGAGGIEKFATLAGVSKWTVQNAVAGDVLIPSVRQAIERAAGEVSL